MTDDLVTRLRADELPGDRQRHIEARIELWAILQEAAARIEFLEAALLKIHMLAEARSRHAWDDHATYYRISTAALDGKTDDGT